MFVVLAGLGLAALPAVLIILYVVRLDKARPEPVGLIGRSVVFGFLAVIPAVILELGLDALLPPIGGIAGRVFESFVAAGLVEEGVKLFFLRRYLFRRPEFDERVDGIVYAVCVSLGFAFAENVAYGHGDAATLLARAVTAVPGHALFSGVMGYYLGIAKKEGGGARVWAKGLAWAAGLHGLYDFFVLSGPAAFLVVPLLIFGALALRRLFRASLARDDAEKSGRPYQSPSTPLV